MKQPRLLKKIIVFIIVFLIVNGLFYGFYHRSRQTSYLAAVRQKQARLSSIDSPKLVIVGGSNTAFGIDSTILEEELGYPVVNMGLQGGLGCLYPLEEIQQSLKPGDIVVLIPEYHCISESPNLYGDAVLYQLMVVAPLNVRHLTTWGQAAVIFQEAINQYASVFLNIRENLDLIVDPHYDAIYNPSGFNANGDLTTHLDRDTLSPQPVPFTIDCTGGACTPMIDVYNQFADDLAGNGVSVYLTFPAYLVEGKHEDMHMAECYSRYVVDHLQFPVFGQPQDFFYPGSYFFDTYYHLTAVGRELRTRQLLADLQAVLGQTNSE
ncbi:MAG: hypothetical protein HPY85_13075 [Anaerolineae bacterium]|nr:hypothetical protein [Anaerolineae bacterium]